MNRESLAVVGRLSAYCSLLTKDERFLKIVRSVPMKGPVFASEAGSDQPTCQEIAEITHTAKWHAKFMTGSIYAQKNVPGGTCRHKACCGPLKLVRPPVSNVAVG
jgi:hypothetical protein